MTPVVLFEQRRTLLKSFANLQILRSKRRPQSTATVAGCEMGNYPKRWFPIAFYID
ncbi:MAG: hypothetical protein U0Z17_04755 [Bacteroidales bacterium]